MEKRILDDGFKPRYYTGNNVITGDHVARFYGACLCRMNHGGRLIKQIFETREIMNAVASIQASMPKGALEDLTPCLHYKWRLKSWGEWCDNGVWDDIYDDPKVVADLSTVIHRLEHDWLEDGYNKVGTVVYLLLLSCFKSITKNCLPSFFFFFFFFFFVFVFLQAVASYSQSWKVDYNWWKSSCRLVS